MVLKTLLILLALARARPAQIATQEKTDTLHVSPGDGTVNARLLHPYTARYVVRSIPCATAGADSSPTATARYRLDIVAGDRDTLLRQISGPASADEAGPDTSIYDWPTLALRWSREHFKQWIAVYDVRGSKLLWSLKTPSRSDSLQAPLEHPVFFDGSQALIVQALSVLDRPGTVLELPFGGIIGIGDEQRLGTYSLLAEVKKAERITLKGLGVRQAWVVGIGSSLSEHTYWIDTSTRQILMWESAAYEGVCPRRGVLIAAP